MIGFLLTYYLGLISGYLLQLVGVLTDRLRYLWRLNEIFIEMRLLTEQMARQDKFLGFTLMAPLTFTSRLMNVKLATAADACCD